MTMTPEQRRLTTIDYLLREGATGAVTHTWRDAGVTSSRGRKQRICTVCERTEVLNHSVWKMPSQNTPGDPGGTERAWVHQLEAHGFTVPQLVRPPLAPAHKLLRETNNAGFVSDEKLRDDALLTMLDYLQEVRPDILDTAVQYRPTTGDTP